MEGFTGSGSTSTQYSCMFPVVAQAVASKVVLVVEDDVPLANFLGRELRRNDCTAIIKHDAEAALRELDERSFDLVITDLNLPAMDGMELLARVRKAQPRLPILVLTARNRTEDRVQALHMGADDCLVKPFSYREMMARLGSLLRRDASPAAAHRVGDLTVNKEERRVMRGSRRIDLTPREFAILEYLMDNAGRPVSRMTLMRDVWNLPFDATTNIVDVYMKYLRDKIDQEGLPKLIHTVRGIGYVLSHD